MISGKGFCRSGHRSSRGTRWWTIHYFCLGLSLSIFVYISLCRVSEIPKCLFNLACLKADFALFLGKWRIHYNTIQNRWEYRFGSFDYGFQPKLRSGSGDFQEGDAEGLGSNPVTLRRWANEVFKNYLWKAAFARHPPIDSSDIYASSASYLNRQLV